MKNTIRTLIIATLLLGPATTRAHADDEAWAALGGFVAGVITGAVIEDSNDYHGGVSIAVGERRGRYDRYDRGRHDRYDRHPGHRGKGHWEIKRVRVWIPGRWEFTVNRCGDRIRVWEPGHYGWRREKVWVRHHGRHHDRGFCD
ncbi:MAG: hypothetical protein ACP5I4_01055 [Oceanipulchritudo sp.]